MKFLAWLIGLAFFALVFWFALNNAMPVPVRLTGSLRWDAVPLVALILGCFLVGVIAGFAALLPRLIRMRVQIAQLTRQVRRSGTPEAVAERLAEQVASAARNVGAVGQLDADTRFPH
jgi:uncharacterized integral membrane protein